MLRGIDVSHYQGSVPWTSLTAKYGLTFGAAKALEGTRTRDRMFTENWRAMTAAGLVRIAYHYAHPDQDASTAAAAFVDVVAPSRPTDLLCLDLETSDGQSPERVNAYARAWAARVRELAPAYTPGIYMGSAYLTSRTGAGLRDPRYFGWLWYPRYPGVYYAQPRWPTRFTPPGPLRNGVDIPWAETVWGQPPDIWQFSQTFPAAGPYDANVFDGDRRRLESLNGQPEEDEIVELHPDHVALLRAAKASAELAASRAAAVEAALVTLPGRLVEELLVADAGRGKHRTPDGRPWPRPAGACWVNTLDEVRALREVVDGLVPPPPPPPEPPPSDPDCA